MLLLRPSTRTTRERRWSLTALRIELLIPKYPSIARQEVFRFTFFHITDAFSNERRSYVLKIQFNSRRFFHWNEQERIDRDGEEMRMDWEMREDDSFEEDRL